MTLRRGVAAGLVVLVVGACTSSAVTPARSGSSARSVSPVRSQPPGPSARPPQPSARPSVGPNRRHPGAAVLAGDAAAPSGVPFIPAAGDALADVPAYWHRCHAPKLQTVATGCALGYRSAHPRKTVVLVGDSAAGAWMIPLNVIGAARHWRVIAVLHTLCTWTSVYVEHPLVGTVPYTACHEWGANAERLLLSIRPDAVISTDRPIVRTPQYPAGGPGAVGAVGRGIAYYWQRLLAHGVPVVAIRETPEPGIDEPKCLATHPVSRCSVSRRQAIAHTTPVTVAEARVHRAVPLVDLNRFICSSTCSPVVGNVEVYRDRHHLTQTFALTLVPYLERALLKVPALAGG